MTSSSEQPPKEYIITEEQVEYIEPEFPITAMRIRSRPHTPAHPPEAQQRTDAAIKELYKARGAGTFEEIDNRIDEAIALLQAGRK